MEGCTYRLRHNANRGAKWKRWKKTRAFCQSLSHLAQNVQHTVLLFSNAGFWSSFICLCFHLLYRNTGQIQKNTCMYKEEQLWIPKRLDVFSRFSCFTVLWPSYLSTFYSSYRVSCNKGCNVSPVECGLTAWFDCIFLQLGVECNRNTLKTFFRSWILKMLFNTSGTLYLQEQNISQTLLKITKNCLVCCRATVGWHNKDGIQDISCGKIFFTAMASLGFYYKWLIFLFFRRKQSFGFFCSRFWACRCS